MANKVLSRAALLLVTAVILTTGFIGSSMANVSSNAVVRGVYSCCGDKTCSTLIAVAACPSGDGQCANVKINDQPTKCCVNSCNDPHTVPVDPVDPDN